MVVTDDETAGVAVAPTALNITEDGSGTFTVVLSTEPEADVIIAVASQDTTEALVSCCGGEAASSTTLTFTDSGGVSPWSTAQTVTVQGVVDGIIDAPQTFNVTVDVDAASPSSPYTGLSAADVDDVSVIIQGETNPPGDVTQLAAEPGDGQVVLTWIDPPDADLGGVLVLARDDGVFPTGPNDANAVVVADVLPGVETVTDTGLNNGVQQLYKVFAYDQEFIPNHAPGVSVEATPLAFVADTTSTNFRMILEGLSSDYAQQSSTGFRMAAATHGVLKSEAATSTSFRLQAGNFGN